MFIEGAACQNRRCAVGIPCSDGPVAWMTGGRRFIGHWRIDLGVGGDKMADGGPGGEWRPGDVASWVGGTLWAGGRGGFWRVRGRAQS